MAHSPAPRPGRIGAGAIAPPLLVPGRSARCRRQRAMARRARAPLLLALLFAAAAAAPRPAAGELILTYSVTRHGSRNVLPKAATLQEDQSSGGPTLLPAGAVASRAAGARLSLCLHAVWRLRPCLAHRLAPWFYSAACITSS